MADRTAPPHSPQERALARALRIIERAFQREGAAPFTSPQQVGDFLRAKLGGLEHEEFHACWLDAQHRLIAVERLFAGTLNQTSVYPREVVKSALRHNAAAVILAHNHPSGTAEPSPADILLTKQLREALALIEIKILDHIIVTAAEASSLAQRGDI